MKTIDFQSINHPQIFFGLLTLIYFIIQPWFRTTSNDLWLLISLFSLAYIAYLIVSKQNKQLETPKRLKQLFFALSLLPLVSIVSYLASPLENMTPSQLEPDIRWLLIIPIIIALRAAEVGPRWIIACIAGYILSSFTSAFIDTNNMQNLRIRANGDENAVTYGMFNATVTLMALAVFVSAYIKNNNHNTIKPIVIRAGLIVIFTLGIIACFLSGTRAAIMLIPLVLAVLYATQYSTKKAILGSGVILLTLTTFITLNQQTAFVKRIISTPEKIVNYFEKADKKSKLTSVGQRLEIWQESVCIFKKHPILGTGPRSFSQAHQKFGGIDHCNATQYLQQGFYQAHSVYFNTLGTLGIAGIISLSLIVFLSMKQIPSALKSTSTTIQLGGLLMLTVLLCHIINGLTVDLWFRNHVISKNLLIWALPVVLIFGFKKTTQNAPMAKELTN